MVIARHGRCFGQKQDVIEPLHYLAVMVQRPGAFEHAIPIRRWRAEWPPVYEALLAELRRRWPAERGLREFLSILELHQQYAPEMLAQAIRAALELGAVHLDGVKLCLCQLDSGHELPVALDLSAHTHLSRS